MKIKDFSDINPQPSLPIHERPFIDYIDTSSVENGIFTGAEHVTSGFPSRAQREIKTGDILISSVRPNLRHNFFVTKSEHGMIASSGFIHIRVLDLQKVNPLFLYYFLTSPTQVHRYEKVAESSQSAYPSFNKSLIEETDFPDISLPVQLRIAGLLGSLDEKIAICRKKIAELEALAKLVYERWFVEFEFPNADGKPFKSNGGKMVWNEVLKQSIPDGWTSARLDSIVSDDGESIDSTEVGNLPYTPIDSLPIRQVSFFDSKPSSEAQSSLIRYQKGDILLGAMRVYFHRVCIAPYDGVSRTTTIAMRACQKNLSAFAFETINMDRFVEYAVIQSNGSQQPFVTWNSVRDFSFAAPPSSLWQVFEGRVGPILDEIVHLEKNAFEAARLRDWLLPMLMNGQIEVRA